MVSPSQRRHAVRSVVAAGVCSLRQACRYLDLARSSLGYRRRPPDERRMQVEAAIVEESRRHPRYGYRRVHALIERRGLGCARRTVQRVRRREGLRVLGPARKPRCPARPDAKIKAEGVNDVWCVDLVFDVTRHGVTLKFLTIVDEGSRYCIDIVVGRRMTARDVVRVVNDDLFPAACCLIIEGYRACLINMLPRELWFIEGGRCGGRGQAPQCCLTLSH